jgi:polysaccharide biosynthesis/export protein
MRKPFLLLLFSLTAIYAQDLAKSAREFSGLETALRKTDIQPLPTAPILEQPVNPDQYILGPGDVLSVLILSTTEVRHQIMVDPEGRLLIPNVGSLAVAGLTLSRARENMVEKIGAKYLSKEISVSLQQLRLFRVSVTGAVYKPGLVTVSALYRASDAIDLAGGLKKKLAVVSQTQQTQVQSPMRSEYNVQTMQVAEEALLHQGEASQRNIVIRRANGLELKADLLRYQLTGKVDANPWLQDGDVIFVPNRQNNGSYIIVNGAVKAPNVFEYAPGDRISDILELTHGYATDADSSFMEIVRFNDGGSQANTIRVNLTDKSNMEFPIRPDDRLYVRALVDYHEQSNVEVIGEVISPGHYAITMNETRLSHIIAQAGGFTRQASLKNAYVIRRADEDTRDPEFERLKKMEVMEMTENEREYFKIKTRERIGGMGVDFVALFEHKDKAQDVVLRDRDFIVVPAQEQTVKITGQVINPGLYIYKPNMTLSYYLKEAGGYNWNARKNKIRIIKSKTGEWMKPNDNAIIEVGDTIFVPEKPERDFWVLAKDLITVVAQLATIYLVVDNASK